MGTTSRRHFLKASAGVAATVSLSNAVHGEGRSDDHPASDVPAQQPVVFPGLHAYAQKSLTAGDEIVFRVSSSIPYDLRVLRLDGEVDDPATDIEIGSFNEVSAGVQPVYLGSHVHVPKSIEQSEMREGLTLECWLRPWGFNHPSGILTQVDRDGNGVGLLLRSAAFSSSPDDLLSWTTSSMYSPTLAPVIGSMRSAFPSCPIQTTQSCNY